MKPQKEHKAPINPVYRRAILKAIESLHDFQLRSNVDAIRKNAQSSFVEEGHHDNTWNDVIFMKTFKQMVHEGQVEQCAFVNGGLSPEVKRKRADSLREIAGKMSTDKEQQQQPAIPVLPALTADCHSHITDSPKQAPKRKSEHEKWKIMPKKIYDKTIITNPMDTH